MLRYYSSRVQSIHSASACLSTVCALGSSRDSWDRVLTFGIWNGSKVIMVRRSTVSSGALRRSAATSPSGGSPSAKCSFASGVVGNLICKDDLKRKLGSEVTTSPYDISWDTMTVANGSHTLTAIAVGWGLQHRYPDSRHGRCVPQSGNFLGSSDPCPHGSPGNPGKKGVRSFLLQPPQGDTRIRYGEAVEN